jgi:hypothetical protein
MAAKSWYPVNLQLCVLPTDGESQYEAFQSIFASIMFGQYGKNRLPESPYEILCRKHGINLIASKNKPNPDIAGAKAIFFNPEGVTHYKALVNGQEVDPYINLQPANTQGFCQMFAFFLTIQDLNGFIPANQSKKIDIQTFNILCHNTKTCFDKIIPLFSDAEVMTRFAEYFNHIMSQPAQLKHYGIRPGTTHMTYLNEFAAINNDVNSVKSYIYDQPLIGYAQGVPKFELWFLPDVKPPTYKGNPPVIGGKRKMNKSKTKKRQLLS